VNAKNLNLTYWITNASFCVMMAISAALYLLNPEFKHRFAPLGFPPYFRVELAIFKFAGVAVLLLPFPRLFKEWAFAGFFIDLISAFIAHLASGDGWKKAMSPLSVAVLLAISYVAYNSMGRR